MGTHIRITPQFRDAQTGKIVGVAKLDGTVDDIFALQDRIVTNLMDVLDIELSTGEHEKIGRNETSTLEAYEWYARGRQLFTRFNEDSFREAAECYERAVSIDPEYALAHSGLGSIVIFRYIGRGDPRDLDEGIERLKRAAELDAELGEAHQWLTYAYTRKKMYDEAKRAGRRAIELEPDNAFAHYFLSAALHIPGPVSGSRYVAAVPMYQRTIDLDPTHQPAHAGWANRRSVPGASTEPSSNSRKVAKWRRRTAQK